MQGCCRAHLEKHDLLHSCGCTYGHEVTCAACGRTLIHVICDQDTECLWVLTTGEAI